MHVKGLVHCSTHCLLLLYVLVGCAFRICVLSFDCFQQHVNLKNLENFSLETRDWIAIVLIYLLMYNKILIWGFRNNDLFTTKIN